MGIEDRTPAVLRISLERDAVEIGRFIADRNDDISKMVEQALRDYANGGMAADIAQMAEAEMRQQVRQSIKSYFQFGKGRRSVDKIVQAALGGDDGAE